MRDLQAIYKSKINYRAATSAVKSAVKSTASIAAKSAAFIAGCAILLSVASVNALDKKTQLKLGEMEFLNNCAACHGRDAKGNGPVAAALTTKPYDLTLISKKHNGKFPEGLVYKIIVGHDIINSHGGTDMPVWGDRYTSTPHEDNDGIAFPLHEQDTQAMILGRITSLIGYLESIQAK